MKQMPIKKKHLPKADDSTSRLQTINESHTVNTGNALSATSSQRKQNQKASESQKKSPVTIQEIQEEDLVDEGEGDGDSSSSYLIRDDLKIDDPLDKILKNNPGNFKRQKAVAVDLSEFE